MPGYMYILECSNGTYYTGSTKYLVTRYRQHLSGQGANHTRKFPPVVLLYYEKYSRIDWAFDREKQVQNWSRAKKEALMESRLDDLYLLAECQNASHCKNIELDKLAQMDSDMVEADCNS